MTDPLAPSQLRTLCDPSTLAFDSTQSVDGLDVIVGQDRAIEALDFGLKIKRKGYNIFAIGPTGSGRHTVVGEFLAQHAKNAPVPDDWCYVHDFDDVRRPRAVRMPPGRAVKLKKMMEELLEEIRHGIPLAFESPEYTARREAIDDDMKKRQGSAMRELVNFANERSVAIAETPVGVSMAAVRDGRPLSEDEADKLPNEEKQRIETNLKDVGAKIEAFINSVPKWQKEHRTRIRELDRETVEGVIHHLMEAVIESHQDLPEVLDYLDRVRVDLRDHVRQVLSVGESPEAPSSTDHEPPTLDRYRVNVLIDNGGRQGAPVVAEDHPTVPNLMGRIEHISRFGALSTNFTLISAGALHRANGGYLVIDARKLLGEPMAWEQIKRSLRSGEIRTESLGELLGLVSTVSLEPVPIPLDLKVVLICDRRLYYLLDLYDPDLGEHFKVLSDFEEWIPRDEDSSMTYARLIAKVAVDKGLRPFDRGAVARIVDQAAEWAEDAGRLSTNIRSLSDLMVEADHHAEQAGSALVRREDVERTIDASIRRSDRVRARVLESIAEGVVLIDTSGARTGQVNALSVRQLGSFMFGHPSRVTARSRPGAGQVVDIERKVELGGPIHSKGVLILTGFLGGKFALDGPLSLSASLVFEQSYGGVEGDSASLAELCALLSALADAPIDQSFAMTGSVNQHGEVQAIGGVNEKIEGFFDVCAKVGAPGPVSVVIPKSNVRHLMLRADVVEAAAAGRLRVFPIAHVDEAIALLTRVPAGERGPDGAFPPESVYGKVEARLHAFAEATRKRSSNGGDASEAKDVS